jgi:hypothetical protein
MASTYSNLKLQLMTTGENLATWGDTTNVNLGTAVEEAIVGSADVTFSSGNVTLTLINSNVTQTARNMRLNLIGTTGGARNLVVPAIEKIYVVNNTCADAVTVKNSTGTGIAVPAGATMWVYNDGTNVVDVMTNLANCTGLPISYGCVAGLVLVSPRFWAPPRAPTSRRCLPTRRDPAPMSSPQAPPSRRRTSSAHQPTTMRRLEVSVTPTSLVLASGVATYDWHKHQCAPLQHSLYGGGRLGRGGDRCLNSVRTQRRCRNYHGKCYGAGWRGGVLSGPQTCRSYVRPTHHSSQVVGLV